jgi:hypothetical protein
MAKRTQIAPASAKFAQFKIIFSGKRTSGGLYSIEDMRPINETRMRARWKLGRALALVERAPEGRPSNTVKPVNSFWKWVTAILA